MTQREDALKFEQSRIKSLQEERLLIQKKTFTKWINSFLLKARMEVEDLFTDLADGKKLLKLLEIISGERLAKPNNGRMRVHKIENVNKSLAFLHTKVRLESIGAEDIVDGNPRLILGLIWTIILRFQIQEIEIDVDEENESSEKKSAKDALLLWCQRKTNGYPGVNIQDFTGSWRSGLGFNALIHAHRPDLVNWSDLQQTKHIDNLNYAFDVANSELGIPRLLDAEDVDTTRPDEKSIMTYVASYYHTFARMKNEIKSGKRIANIVGQMMDADKMKVHYGKLTTDLLEWIKLKIVVLEDRNFPNSLEGIQRELLAFKQYRTIEKPPKYKERSEIEALYFHINLRLKSLNQPAFVPQEGQLVNDIERKWIELERAEHRREVALRSELLRHERLEQLNYKFERKSVLREGYLKEMIQVLSDPRYGSNLAQVDATVKKHEAISADILAREERFHDLTNMSEELVRENYHGLERVQAREQQVLQRWRDLLGLLDRHKANLSALCSLMSLMREIETTLASVQELQLSFQSTEVGPHLLGVEDLLQRHSLQELQVTALGESQRRLARQAAQVQTQVAVQAQQAQPHALSKEAALLEAKLEQLNKAYGQLGEYSKERKARLEDARNFFQFLQDHEDEESWLVERQRICRAGIVAKDLRALISLQQKHKALEDETKTRRPKSEQLSQAGRRLVCEQHPSAPEIENRLESLQEHWRVLEELLALRKKQLEEAAEALQFCADANEADSWMKEKMALVASEDYGVDEPSAQALLQRHKDLEGELNAYRGDLQSLNAQAERLQRAGISALQIDQTQNAESEQAEPLAELEQEEWTQEVRLVPQDEWVDEIVERTEPRTVLEERLVPQVRSLYPFSGQGMQMVKGEVMLLLNKTNPDWWSVRKADGTDGFVPASYVREVEPKVIQVQVRKPERVRVTQRVKKTRMVRQVVPVRRVKSTRSAVKPVRRPAVSDNENLEKRMKKINDTYGQLQELATRRHALLEDAIRLYGFYRECDDFEKWIKDREKMLKADDSRDNVETAKRKYEKFLTDLSASGKRVEAIDAAVEEFVTQGHSQLDKVRARQRHIHQLWEHLNWLKAQKEKSLEGASSVELFNRTCDEAHDWMLEKITQLDTAELGPDLKTVQALQRRHQHLERELAPVEEKVRKVNLLANSVKSTYPNELNNVNARQNEIRDLWHKVQNKARERRSRLEDAVGQQIFMNSSKNLISWATETLETMNVEEPVRDIATAEKLRKQHVELGEEIKTKEDEFREVEALGGQLLLRNPALNEVKERHEKLHGLYDNVTSTWLSKEAWLEQCLELQQFNREADQIDATTSSHATFLEFTDLGESLDDVEALLKQHEKFENTLHAQDDRLKVFSDVADKLIAQDHYDKNNINEKRNQVLARRATVKEAAQRRRAALQASEYYQQFSAEVDDLKDWLSDKMKTASDETYRDLNNLERKLQKHEAFERELRANEGQLRAVNKAGKALISEENYRSEDVGRVLEDLNKQWDQLVVLSMEKGRRLRQAAAQHGYNRIIEDARLDLEEIENSLASKEVGQDLRSCKDLLKKHQLLETKLGQWEQKVNDLVQMGQEMAHEGHFDAPNILKTSQDTQKKFQSLKEPAKRRRDALEESLRFHKFGFELDAELQWINDHLPQATSTMMGQNLHQTQSLHKKHKKFEAEVQGHEPMIMKTLASGQGLIDQAHPERKKIQDLCDTLSSAWNHLREKGAERSHALDLSLKAQEFFFEAGEVESWLVEKNDVLNSTDYGRDRDAATKLLTKHKALELELDTYNGIVTEMGNTASTMINAKHPDSKAIANKQQAIAQQVRSLQRLATLRQQRLMESMYRHEYFLESRELEQWIKEQEQTASSEDYGQDYEHLLLLQAKFNDFKHRIEAGSERFNQCQVLAKKLIANESPYIQDIEKRQEQLGESWQHLLKLVRNREQRLQAAGEIHRFHRDVAEALSRIQEKKAALPDDLGRDLNSVLALIRRHEGFENDLVALEAQLQVLVEDAARLQALYPGNNAAHIDQQQKIVLANWEELKEKSAHRRDQLQASCDLQRFLTQVRDLTNWTAGLCATMSTQDNVRDAASAQILKAEHEALKGEIEAREDTFSNVLDLGEAMVQTGHYAASEVEEKCSQLLDERQKLHTAWQQKKIHLDQLIDLHFFLRDAKQLDNLSTTQEAALSNDNFGVSVEEVDAQVKKHNEFEKLLLTQEDKLAALQEHGSKLLSQNHFESRTIAKRLDEVIKRRARIRELCNARRARLEAGLLHAQFVRDVGEAESWIGERQKKLEAEASKGQVSSLEDKIKKLQKHQAFQAELAANQSRIEEIKVKGETLLMHKHPASAEIRQQLDHLLSSWKKLLIESENRGRGLEEAQDILDFNNQVEKIEAWIRDKEMMVQAGDIGKDYEHCLSLQRKLDDVDSDMRVDDARIKTINALADKLIKQEKDEETKAIQQRRDGFNNKWRGLQGALGAYRETLAAALEIHLFNRDIDDTNQRVVEKSLAMNTNDVGKDLAGVDHLQRKQEAMERDMTAIEGKLKEHQTEAHILSQKYPEKASQINGILSELETNWSELQRLTSDRRQALSQAYTLHKFRAELRELEIWVAETIKRMNEVEPPTTILEAEALLELHQERKAEIDGRQDTFKALGEHGRKLIPMGEYIQESLDHLEQLQQELNDAWLSGKQKLKQAHQLQLFKEQANQADSWLATKEAFLNNDDLGDSLSGVEKLMRKHEDFEKMLTPQLGRIEELEKFASAVLSEGHADAPSIESRLAAVCARRDKLKNSALARRNKLVESRRLHQFLRNVLEVEGWLHEKQQVASDENYRDSTNLQSKIQKHVAFESELAANKGRVSAVTTEGEALVKEDHFASKEIQERLDELEAEWELLQETSKLKKNRLDDAYQALLFSRTLDEFEAWIDEIETQLQSEDHGKDLSSVANLLKRHTNLENDVMSHNEACESIKETAANFQRAKHFMSEEIQERAAATITRYHGLQEPIQIRRDNLEDAKLLHQFARDVEDELHWLSEKEVLAGSKDLGSSLTTVQRLQKKHHALEAELISREPVVASLASRATAMVRSGHFASEKIESLSRELQEKLMHLRDLASVRKLRLLDAVESQMFYAEAAEAEQWIKEKQPLLNSTDYGKDEDSVQSLFKKLEGVERDLCGFTSTVENLKKLSKGLVERHHFDSKNIAYKQSEIEQKFENLQNLKEKRSQRLLESEKYHRFIMQADQVIEWIGDQTTIAASEDYGCDVEHVELLIQMFENFLSSLISSESRMTGIIEAGQKLLEEKNPESSKIHSKIDETKQQWEDLKELAHARQEALAGAKQVHMFDRTADETISWIQEKEATLGSDHEYAHDLETIQALVRKHQGLDTDLGAVKEQVEAVMEEASRLAALFPDATEHIAVKHEQVDESWNDLLEKASQRKGKLVQAEQLQAYFDEYRDLISWINEMVAKVTAPELARDVPGAEALISRHNEYRAEIDTHDDAFSKFYKTGQALVQQGHFLAKEIQEKVSVLRQRSQILEETWEQRKLIYEQNLDTQTFKRDAETLENWIASREPMLRDEQYGESIPQVEELIMKHQDFEKTIEAQEEKFNAIKRITMLEKAFQKQLETEMAARQAEKERVEKARLEERKRKEVQRITEERKREEERRRYIESPRHVSRDEMNGTYDDHEAMNRSSSPMKGGTGDASQNTATTSKSYGGLHHMLSDRLRRTSAADIKRAESMKVDTKKPKRTPSFTTRRRTQSFRKHQRIENVDSLPPVEIQGVLERKHELQSGGKKAAVRSWKPYYTVLCGQLLCFFKDIDDFQSSKAATAPINIFHGSCERAEDYTKRKNVFRLKCTDGSEFLFLASSKQDMEDWVNKISFHAKLPPSLQLMSYDDSHKDLEGIQNLSPDHLDDAPSTGSSHASTPEMERKNSVIRRDVTPNANQVPADLSPKQQQQQQHQQQVHKKRSDPNRNSENVGRSTPDTQPQKEFLQMYMQQQQQQQQQQHQQHHHHHPMQQQQQQPQSRPHDQHVNQQHLVMHSNEKPPIPPRGAPPPVPARSPSFENTVPLRRNDVEQHYGQQNRPQSYQPTGGNMNLNGTSGQYNANDGSWHRPPNVEHNAHYQQQEIVPPLPSTAPPPSNKIAHWNSPHDNAYGNLPVNSRQIAGHQMNTFTGRPTSLPPYVAPPMASSPTSSPSISVVDGAGRRASESGSESEQSFGGSRKDRDYKKSSVLSNLFGRRKKPSQQ